MSNIEWNERDHENVNFLPTAQSKAYETYSIFRQKQRRKLKSLFNPFFSATALDDAFQANYSFVYERSRENFKPLCAFPHVR